MGDRRAAALIPSAPVVGALLLSALLASACTTAGPLRIRRDRMAYNEAIVQTGNEQLLLNLAVNARDERTRAQRSDQYGLSERVEDQQQDEHDQAGETALEQVAPDVARAYLSFEFEHRFRRSGARVYLTGSAAARCCGRCSL